MAEDDRAIAESSASRNLQGGMELHLCCSRLQPGPYAESSDSNGVSQGRSAFAARKTICGPPADGRQNPSPSHKIAETGENLSRDISFSAACYGFFSAASISGRNASTDTPSEPPENPSM